MKMQVGGANGLAHSTALGQVVVATPVLIRVRQSATTIGEDLEVHNQQKVQSHETGIQYVKQLRKFNTRQHSKKAKSGQHAASPLETLRGSVSTAIWPLYVGLYNALESLLKACPTSTVKRSSGPRSLFSTCLRTIPSYLREEELWLEEYTQGNVDSSSTDSYNDTTTDIYEDLEATWATSSQGWKPLREVVRAHGIFIISQAILDGLFHAEYVKALVDVCTSYQAFDEAKFLLKSLLAVTSIARKPPSTKCRLFETQTSVAFSALASFVHLSGDRGFLYRQLTRMLRNHDLAPEWLVTPDFVSLWDAVIVSISQEDENYADAYHFMEAVIISSFKFPIQGVKAHDHLDGLNDSSTWLTRGSHEETALCSSQARLATGEDHNDAGLDVALENTVTSLVEALWAVFILSSRSQDRCFGPFSIGLGRAIPQLFTSIAVSVEYEFLQHMAGRLRDKHNLQRIVTALFANTLLLCRDGAHHAQEDLYSSRLCSSLLLLLRLVSGSSEGFSSECTSDANVLERLAQSVHSVASCCSRGTRGDEIAYLKNLIESIVSLGDSTLANQNLSLREQDMLHQIIACSVSNISDDQTDEVNGQWLTSVRARFKRAAVQAEAGGEVLAFRDSSVTEYAVFDEWEEDLCERLARTPALSKKRRRSSVASASSEDSFQLRGVFKGNVKPVIGKPSHPKLSLMLLGSSPEVCRATRKRASSLATLSSSLAVDKQECQSSDEDLEASTVDRAISGGLSGKNPEIASSQSGVTGDWAESTQKLRQAYIQSKGTHPTQHTRREREAECRKYKSHTKLANIHPEVAKHVPRPWRAVSAHDSDESDSDIEEHSSASENAALRNPLVDRRAGRELGNNSRNQPTELQSTSWKMASRNRIDSGSSFQRRALRTVENLGFTTACGESDVAMGRGDLGSIARAKNTYQNSQSRIPTGAEALADSSSEDELGL